jgi:O-antigen ligase
VTVPGHRDWHLAASAGWIALTLPLLLVLLSVAISPQSNWTVRAGLAAFCLLAFRRPAAALLVTTALVGFGVILSHMAGVPTLRVTEVLVVATLAGCCVNAIPRGSTLRGPLAAGMSPPVVLLALAAFASTLVWLRVHQVETGYPSAYVQALLQFLVRDYFVQQGEFRLLVTTAMLLEGLALYVAAAALARADSTVFPRSLRMLVLGGAGLGILSAVRLAEVLLRNPEAIAALQATAAGLRISPQIADYIAAGSYFALCWLASLGLAIASPRHRWLWVAAGIPLMTALYLTGSRSVIAAALAGVVALAFMAVRHRTAAIGRIVAFAVIGVVIMVVSYPWLTGRDVVGRTAVISIETRVELARTTVRVIETRPLFGVGFDRFQRLADGLASPRLNALWQGRKNPHNDFLRVGAELGLVGLGLLVWILGAAGRRIWRALRVTADVRLAGLAGGLVAFLVTSMISDPLMVREVSYAFWIALGIGVGHAAGTPRQAAPAAAVTGSSWSGRRLGRWSLAVFLGGSLLVSVPARATQELRSVDLRHVQYGLFDWGVDDQGVPNRWSGPRATLFVDARARLVELPLSGTLPGGARQQVEVRVDGRLANRLSVGSEWEQLRIALTATDVSTARRIDLLVSPTWIPAEVLRNEDHRELGVKVGAMNVLMATGENR